MSTGAGGNNGVLLGLNVILFGNAADCIDDTGISSCLELFLSLEGQNIQRITRTTIIAIANIIPIQAYQGNDEISILLQRLVNFIGI